jgi:hypothetical protein
MTEQANIACATRYALLFNGKPEDFKIWWTRFKAFASVQGFASALIDQTESDLPETEATEITDDEAGNARHLNEIILRSQI